MLDVLLDHLLIIIRAQNALLNTHKYVHSEHWRLKKQGRKSIEAFELWYWRRPLRISWIVKETVLNKFTYISVQCTNDQAEIIIH